MRAVLRPAAIVTITLWLTGCGDDEPDPMTPPECTADFEKRAALALMRDWYLYPELLPSEVDPAEFESTHEMIRELTAVARGERLDRGWTFLTTAEELESRGTGVGFGFQLMVLEDRIVINDVHADSAAGEAGFVRGDEILAIGPTSDALVPVAELIEQEMVFLAFGPSEAGVTRAFEVMTAGGVVIRTVTKREFDIDPVPSNALLAREGKSPVGYLHLRTFADPEAMEQLEQVFETFFEAGVTDVILDLRYNGGGALSLAQQLANLLGRSLNGRTMFTVEHSPPRMSNDRRVDFSLLERAIPAERVAIIQTDATASASELVANALEPHVSVALVGTESGGKPVGQYLFGIEPCETVLSLVSFRLENAQGDGGYYEGLPDERFSGPLCPAEDDVSHPQGDPAEASTAAALGWLESGECAVTKRALRRAFYPLPERPALWQRDLPGLF